MSTDSEQEAMDLDASETESDNESENDSESDGESNDGRKTTEDRVRNTLTEKYKARHGKQLFIRFPARLPEDELEFQKKARALSPLIIEAHKPRQKHARFCLVEFSSQNHRDEALKSIRAAIKTDNTFKGMVALIPRTESEGFVDELISKKIKSIEAKRAKTRLKRESKRSKGKKEFTSMVVVQNLPANVSMSEMRKLFPTAVDIQLKSQSGKKNKSSIATVTLQSSFDAREIVKKKLSLGGTALSIRFHIGRPKNEKNESNVQQKHEDKKPIATKTCLKEKSKKSEKI